MDLGFYIEDAAEEPVNGPGTAVDLILFCTHKQQDTDGREYLVSRDIRIPLPRHSVSGESVQRPDLKGRTLRIAFSESGAPRPEAPPIPVLYGTPTHDQYGRPRSAPDASCPQ